MTQTPTPKGDDMEQEMTVEIKACPTPWCEMQGGKPYVFERRYDAFGVYCPTCSVSTPYFPNSEAAVECWNTRAAPAVPQDVAGMIARLAVLRADLQRATGSGYEIIQDAADMLAALSQQPSPVAVEHSRFHFTNENAVVVHTADGLLHLGAGWLAISEAEYVALARTGQGYGREIEPTEAMIEAGEDQLEKCAADLREENYIPGKTPDWDYGMEAEAVYRAMEAARVKFLAAPLDGEG